VGELRLEPRDQSVFAYLAVCVRRNVHIFMQAISHSKLDEVSARPCAKTFHDSVLVKRNGSRFQP
jgi:hypothetical protein